MSTEISKPDKQKVVTLSNVIEQIKAANIGTNIMAVYALIDPDYALLSCVSLDAEHPDGGYVEETPLGVGVNYLIVAIGDVEAKKGLHFPQKE